MTILKSIEWKGGKVRIIDQTKLPNELVALDIYDYRDLIDAIKRLSIRGAPALGVAGAFGVVLAVWELNETDRTAFFEKANKAIAELRETRPTANNLFWALSRMRNVMSRHLDKTLGQIKKELLKEAQAILDDDVKRCHRIGENGAKLIKNRATILTHCNAGVLATAGYGTALGVIYSAVEMGKRIKVFVDETRPLLQGARLTTFELLEADIDVTLICDNTAAYVMQQGLIDYVIVGADRIARNGDVANKIGTYNLAVLAEKHGVPFYVAAPLSTFDVELTSGKDIPIEERAPEEVRNVAGKEVAPEEVKVYNPAFDITPNELITSIITDAGVISPPYNENISKHVLIKKT